MNLTVMYFTVEHSFLYDKKNIWILCSRGKNNISLLSFEHKIYTFSPPCNNLYVYSIFSN